MRCLNKPMTHLKRKHRTNDLTRIVFLYNVKKDYVTSDNIQRKINEDITMSSIKLSKEVFKLLPAGWSDEEKKEMD